MDVDETSSPSDEKLWEAEGAGADIDAHDADKDGRDDTEDPEGFEPGLEAAAASNNENRDEDRPAEDVRWDGRRSHKLNTTRGDADPLLDSTNTSNTSALDGEKSLPAARKEE